MSYEGPGPEDTALPLPGSIPIPPVKSDYAFGKASDLVHYAKVRKIDTKGGSKNVGLLITTNYDGVIMISGKRGQILRLLSASEIQGVVYCHTDKGLRFCLMPSPNEPEPSMTWDAQTSSAREAWLSIIAINNKRNTPLPVKKVANIGDLQYICKRKGKGYLNPKEKLTLIKQQRRNNESDKFMNKIDRDKATTNTVVSPTRQQPESPIVKSSVIEWAKPVFEPSVESKTYCIPYDCSKPAYDVGLITSDLIISAVNGSSRTASVPGISNAVGLSITHAQGVPVHSESHFDKVLGSLPSDRIHTNLTVGLRDRITIPRISTDVDSGFLFHKNKMLSGVYSDTLACDVGGACFIKSYLKSVNGISIKEMTDLDPISQRDKELTLVFCSELDDQSDEDSSSSSSSSKKSTNYVFTDSVALPMNCRDREYPSDMIYAPIIPPPCPFFTALKTTYGTPASVSLPEVSVESCKAQMEVNISLLNYLHNYIYEVQPSSVSSRVDKFTI